MSDNRGAYLQETVGKINKAAIWILSLPNYRNVVRPETVTQILTLPDQAGYLPIHNAIAYQHENLFRTLLEIFLSMPSSPYYFNSPDNNGNSPVHWAMLKKNYQAVVELVKVGADISSMNHLGKTPMHIAVEHCGRENSKSDFEVHLSMVKFLIAVGAVVDAYDGSNVTPLHLASELGKLELIETLVEGGAFVNAVDSVGETPLFYAIRNKHYDVVKKLLEVKANLYSRNNEGETPLEYSMALRDSTMTDLLNHYQKPHLSASAFSFNSPTSRMNISESTHSSQSSFGMSLDSLSSSSSEMSMDMSVDLARSEESRMGSNNNSSNHLHFANPAWTFLMANGVA